MRYAQAYILKYCPFEKVANTSNQNTIIGNPIKLENKKKKKNTLNLPFTSGRVQESRISSSNHLSHVSLGVAWTEIDGGSNEVEAVGVWGDGDLR